MRWQVFFMVLFCSACSFDYGEQAQDDGSKPDIVMYKVDYVRMETGEPVVHINADVLERYEKRNTMAFERLSFKHFDKHTGTMRTTGSAETAQVELDSGDIHLTGVSLDVVSESATIAAESLEWQDNERFLTAGTDNLVNIQKKDGTNITGKGFSAFIRDRKWEFSHGIQGIYNEDDD
ncbi:MAG: LPS export ABC transporter periplasmic protein LptC [Spirochaetaceae bacterium]|jgi:LPS export ABC transporter protein LptC|nr:LPS export ABC transporter periplasmic protein LptC [Spirochaetaceae bacterium]